MERSGRSAAGRVLAALAVLAILGGAAEGAAQQGGRPPRDADRTRERERVVEREHDGRAFGGRPRLGISVDVGQDETASAQGARILRVVEGGPADEAGLRDGDVITRIGGRSLLAPLAPGIEEDFDLDASLPVQRLLAIVREFDDGEEVSVEYLRDGAEGSAQVTARAFSPRGFDRLFESERGPLELERIRRGAAGIAGAFGAARHGLRLVPLNEGLGSYFGTSDGVLVVEVDDDSSLGLLAGDVILRIGDREVDTPERVARLLATYDAGEEVTFQIRRNQRELSVSGRVGR